MHASHLPRTAHAGIFLDGDRRDACPTAWFRLKTCSSRGNEALTSLSLLTSAATPATADAVKRDPARLLQQFQARNGGEDFHPIIGGQTKTATCPVG
jgi:hypothetical protein